MSLILEALKKSEAKRRLGDAPDLGTPFTTAARRRSSLPYLVIAIVIAVAAGWWWWRQKTPVQTPPPAHGHVAASDAKQLRPAQSAAPPRRHTQPPNSDKTRPQAIWVAAQRGYSENKRAVRHRTSSVRQTPTPSTSTVNAAASANTPPLTHQPATAAPVAKSNATSSAKAAPANATGKSAPAANQMVAGPDQGPKKPADAVAPKLQLPPGVPIYYELPYNIRQSLPDLKLSMHVYSKDPAQRFVILNNTRMVEGDKTPDDVTLQSIRPDGVILEFQGQRFFYPRDGF